MSSVEVPGGDGERAANIRETSRYLELTGGGDSTCSLSSSAWKADNLSLINFRWVTGDVDCISFGSPAGR